MAFSKDTNGLVPQGAFSQAKSKTAHQYLNDGGLLPLDFFMLTLRNKDKSSSFSQRERAAQLAAPYLHAKIADSSTPSSHNHLHIHSDDSEIITRFLASQSPSDSPKSLNSKEKLVTKEDVKSYAKAQSSGGGMPENGAGGCVVEGG